MLSYCEYQSLFLVESVNKIFCHITMQSFVNKGAFMELCLIISHSSSLFRMKNSIEKSKKVSLTMQEQCGRRPQSIRDSLNDLLDHLRSLSNLEGLKWQSALLTAEIRKLWVRFPSEAVRSIFMSSWR